MSAPTRYIYRIPHGAGEISGTIKAHSFEEVRAILYALHGEDAGLKAVITPEDEPNREQGE